MVLSSRVPPSWGRAAELMLLEAHSLDLETHPNLETQQLGGSLLVLSPSDS